MTADDSAVPKIRDRIKELRRVPASDLRPNPKNWRTHNDEQRAALAGVLSEIGIAGAVIARECEDGTLELIDGHLRQETLPGSLVPVLVLDVTEAEADKLLLTLDPLAALAGTDGAKLGALLDQVDSESAAVTKLLADLAQQALAAMPVVASDVDAEPQIDRADELRKLWGVETGQLWQLGEHRLLCGDSTKPEDVARVMGGELWDCVTTDPPYGVSYEGGRNPVSNTPREKLKGDESPVLYRGFLSAWMSSRATKGVLYIWFAGSCGREVYAAVEDAGLVVRALIVWNKIDAHYGNFMAQYMQKHEPCLYCVKDGTDWHGPTNEVTVWDIKQPTRNEHHPTEKPVECMSRAIRNSTPEGAIVADGFSGSGTTIIACEQLNRRCRAIEISPAYVAVALQRFQDATGKTPTLLPSP